jgi:hypothetical protein
VQRLKSYCEKLVLFPRGKEAKKGEVNDTAQTKEKLEKLVVE